MTIQQAFDLALEHHRAGRLPEAEGIYRQILASQPDQPDALHMLGVVANQSGRADEAVQFIGHAIQVDPARAGFHNNLGLALANLRRWDAAAAAFEKAIALQPTLAHAHNNLGNVLKEIGRLDDSAAAYHRAIELQPNYADAWNNLGNVHQGLHRGPEAIAAYRRALELKPDFPDAQLALASTLLLSGDFEQGWPAYQARWHASGRDASRGFAQPFWDGTDLGGSTILLHAEQGLGDTIQFIRYLPMVRGRGAGNVTLLCPPELQHLLTGQPGLDRVVTDPSALPAFDVHCPLLSLPRIFHTTLNSIPANTPYLRVDPTRSKRWWQKLDALPPSKNVGIVWAGSATHFNDRNRSIPLAAFAPLAVGGIRFFSLQKGEPASQARTPLPGLPLIDWGNEFDDLADTAAFVSHLDLVISVDTAVAHLAGALAKPVWLLLPFAPDWRWMWDRSDSPWYPSMKLFRQPRTGDWQSVIARVADALRRG